MNHFRITSLRSMVTINIARTEIDMMGVLLISKTSRLTLDNRLTFHEHLKKRVK